MIAEPLDQYIEEVKNGVFSAVPYDRLMIHYRKEKNFAEELKVIKKGIAVFKKYYSNLQSSTLKKKKSKITELSRMISKSTGLTDKKGNEVYLPEPLPKWIKRQSVVEQKLKKK
jgi:hypothetical protein